jgi:hypothetical protein
MPYQGGYPHATELKAIRGRYDFAVDGGTVGAHALTVEEIPANAYVLGGFVEVDTALTGATATMAISVEGAGDIVAATVVTGAPYSSTGRKDIIPDFTGSAIVKATAARKIVGTIAVAAVTAGVFDVVLWYVQLND